MGVQTKDWTKFYNSSKLFPHPFIKLNVPNSDSLTVRLNRPYGISTNNASCRERFCNHSPSSNYGIICNSYAGQNNHPRSDPYIGSNGDGFKLLVSLFSKWYLRCYLMFMISCVNKAIRSHHNLVANGNMLRNMGIYSDSGMITNLQLRRVSLTMARRAGSL